MNLLKLREIVREEFQRIVEDNRRKVVKDVGQITGLLYRERSKIVKFGGRVRVVTNNQKDGVEISVAYIVRDSSGTGRPIVHSLHGFLNINNASFTVTSSSGVAKTSNKRLSAPEAAHLIQAIFDMVK